MKCCDINPSQLNRRIGIYKLNKTATATGGFNETWVSVATVWAKVKNMSGTELVRADQLGATAFTDFTIRYRSGIDETMKIVFRNKEYQIRHINNIDEADRFLVIKAERRVSQ